MPAAVRIGAHAAIGLGAAALVAAIYYPAGPASHAVLVTAGVVGVMMVMAAVWGERLLRRDFGSAAQYVEFAGALRSGAGAGGGLGEGRSAGRSAEAVASGAAGGAAAAAAGGADGAGGGGGVGAGAGAEAAGDAGGAAAGSAVCTGACGAGRGGSGAGSAPRVRRPCAGGGSWRSRMRRAW